jgi:hypothetical protein
MEAEFEEKWRILILGGLGGFFEITIDRPVAMDDF